MKKIKIIQPAFILMLLYHFSCQPNANESKLKVNFDSGYGQVEIGGKYVGAEFHKSRPLPSRISFYYPVANSIDLSTDYWKRYESLPLIITIKNDSVIDTVGINPWAYEYTPYSVIFNGSKAGYKFRICYDVCEDLPLLILRISVTDLPDQKGRDQLNTHIKALLRTSHSYQHRTATKLNQIKTHNAKIAAFDYVETDSAVLFIANTGLNPVGTDSGQNSDEMTFDYHLSSEIGDGDEIVQVIGMCRRDEVEQMIQRSTQEWKAQIAKNRSRVLDFVFNQAMFNIQDSSLQQTVYWSKALMAANIHHIKGNYMPMPCPAEYNFFFTHDLLHTSQGAVYFDLEYVKSGLDFLYSLTNPADSILAHAYYWKDSSYVTEYCHADNWNHLWFIITAAKYLRHSGNIKAIKNIFPIIEKSLQLMKTKKGPDNLMYATRPDWWDIGNIYGARSYISILMYRSLHDYVYLAYHMDQEKAELNKFLELAEQIKSAVAERLWDEQAGYLMNMLDLKTGDGHYYNGSLVAAMYGVLDEKRTAILLNTATDTLLDQNLGIRNAMPPDFDRLGNIYKFNGMEMGLPYLYFNGAVWPQGNAWYIMGLLAINQPEQARNALYKYLSLEGIRNSPNGQPSFYEYRITDAASPRYGEIDKPSFLWAGGFYMQAIYQMAGIRENSWNLYLNPVIPSGFEKMEYDVTVHGELCRIKWQGSGLYFREIKMDGETVHSAVLYKAVKHIFLDTGVPKYPYLSCVDGRIINVVYEAKDKKLSIQYEGFPYQPINFSVVSPLQLHNTSEINPAIKTVKNDINGETVYEYEIGFKVMDKNVLNLWFR